VSRQLAVVALLAGLGAPAAAHWLSPEAILAELDSEPARALGVERAARDEKTPRLLVIRVGDGWYTMPAAKRRTQAGAWLELWRHNVAQGIVAVLDARTDRPVVHFGPGGLVAEVTDAPAGAGGKPTPPKSRTSRVAPGSRPPGAPTDPDVRD